MAGLVISVGIHCEENKKLIGKFLTVESRETYAEGIKANWHFVATNEIVTLGRSHLQMPKPLNKIETSSAV